MCISIYKTQQIPFYKTQVPYEDLKKIKKNKKKIKSLRRTDPE
jgi:hypothetical protein